MARLTPMLVLLLMVSLTTPALGRSALDAYADALDGKAASRALTDATADAQAAGGGQPAADDKAAIAAQRRALIAYAEEQINVAKAELREMNAAYESAMRTMRGDEFACERARLTAIVAAERVRLNARLREYRAIRGDRRGFFARAWHAIGPTARRIVRFVGDGALDSVTSGGSLGSGVVRSLLLRAGRQELQGAALRAVSRAMYGRSGAAAEAVAAACGEDRVDPDAPAEDLPAIETGTYVGQVPHEPASDPYTTKERVETNYIEIVVAEDGTITGEIAYRTTSVLDGCPGQVHAFSATIDADQRIGTELPQAVPATSHAYMLVPIGGVSDGDFYCDENVEPFIDDIEPVDLVFDFDTEGELVMALADEPIVLQWVP